VTSSSLRLRISCVLYYRNFLSFTIYGALGVSAFSALGWAVLTLMRSESLSTVALNSSLVVGLYGLAVGAVTASLGFWILLGLSKLSSWPVARFEIVLALILAAAALVITDALRFFRVEGASALFFPLVPSIASCWLFVKLSRDHVRILR
jgi:hypothetical protein